MAYEHDDIEEIDLNEDFFKPEEEIEEENPEEIEQEEKPANNWLTYAQEFGYGEDFLSDVESEEELIKKIKFFEDERKLEDSIQDPEILEAIKLKQEGKISNLKDFASYVYKEPEIISEITDEAAAKAYLRESYKARGIKEKQIDRLLDNLEVDEELLKEANERLTAENEAKQSSVEKRKQEYLEKQEAEKKSFVLEFNQKILQMKETVINQGWDKELKEYVNEELVNTMLEMHTGNATSKTLKKVAEALQDNNKAPKLIAYLHMMIQDDDVTIEPFIKQAKSAAVKDTNKNWKQMISQKKVVSGGNGSGKDVDDIDWNNI
jgi:hypothetical protein